MYKYIYVTQSLFKVKQRLLPLILNSNSWNARTEFVCRVDNPRALSAWAQGRTVREGRH